MGKFYGKIGFGVSVETSPGVWVEEIVERDYYGDVIRDQSRFRDGENLNTDINVDNRISIVSDPYSFENFHHMRYLVWMKAKWKIKSVEVQRPRLILTIGGVFNE